MNAELQRSHRIKDEQEAYVKAAPTAKLLDEIWDRVIPVLTHQREPSYMSIPVNCERDDDAYVGLRITELRRRINRAFSESTSG